MVCAHLEIEGELQHPEYLAAWIKKLQDKPASFFEAAAKAEKALGFLVEAEEAA
jgi:antirestriction protein ArdC